MPAETYFSQYPQPNAFELLTQIESSKIASKDLGLTANNKIVTASTFKNRQVEAYTPELSFSACQQRFDKALDDIGVSKKAITTPKIKNELQEIIYQQKVRDYSDRDFKDPFDSELYEQSTMGYCGSMTPEEVKTALLMEKLLPRNHQKLRNHIHIMAYNRQPVNFPEGLAKGVRQTIFQGAMCVEARNINALTHRGKSQLSDRNLQTGLEQLTKLNSDQYSLFAEQGAIYLAQSMQQLSPSDPNWQQFNNIVTSWPEDIQQALQSAWKPSGLSQKTQPPVYTKFDRMLADNPTLKHALNSTDIDTINTSNLSTNYKSNAHFETRLELLTILRDMGIYISMHQFIDAIQHTPLNESALKECLESSLYCGTTDPHFKAQTEPVLKQLLAVFPCFQAYSGLTPEQRVQLLDKLDSNMLWNPSIAQILDDAGKLNELSAAMHQQAHLMYPDDLINIINSGYFNSQVFLQKNRSQLNALQQQIGYDPQKAHQFVAQTKQSASASPLLQQLQQQIDSAKNFNNKPAPQPRTEKGVTSSETKPSPPKSTSSKAEKVNDTENLLVKNIDEEIKEMADEVKKQVQPGYYEGDTVERDTIESLPDDPNLQCPMCGRYQGLGQIQKHRVHVDKCEGLLT